MTDRAHIPLVDGLRAVAVIFVVLNHLDLGWPASGFLGVDVFFVISGYVITRSLLRAERRDLLGFLTEFYARRVKRLLPALLLCVVVTAVALSMFNPAAGVSLRTGIFASLGLSNVYLWLQSSDYFAESSALNAYLHTWSLGVEEQFYLIFPLILWWSAMRSLATSGIRRMLIATGVLSAISFSSFAVIESIDASAGFYLMPFRFWELGLGVMVFAYQVYRPPLSLNGLHQASALGGLLIVFSMPASLALFTTPFACVLTAVLLARADDRRSTQNDSGGVLSHPWLVTLGKGSYSLYLWHWCVLVLARWTVGTSAWLIPAQLALMAALSFASYRWVERPLRHARWPGGSAVTTLAWGVLGAGATVVLLWALGRPLAGALFTGTPPPLKAYGVSTLTLPYTIAGRSGEWSGEPCVLSSNDDRFVPAWLTSCTLGDATLPRVLILGDSVSAAFVGASQDLVGRYGRSVTVVSSWGASPVPELPNTTAWRRANDRYWQELVPSLTATLRPGDQIVLINDLAGYSPRQGGQKLNARLALFEQGLRRFSAELAVRGVGLAIVHGYPLVRELNCDPSLAVGQWFTPFGSPCRFPDRAESLQRRAPLDRMLTRLEGERVITLIDLFDLFCPGERCTYQAANGAVLYRDVFSHPSIEAAEMAGDTIGRSLLTPLK